VVAAVIFILVRRRKGTSVARYSDPIISSKAGIDQVPDVMPEQVSRPGQDAVPPTATADKLSKEDTDEDKKEHL
jgi:phosphatidylglycerol:prolipoprotein diacylglycerol transferase